MGVRSTGLAARAAFLAELAERDPEGAAELEELRRYDPVVYRKRVKRLAMQLGTFVPAGNAKTRGPTPGRATDPALRVGPGGDTTAEDLRDVAAIRQLEAERAAPEAPAEPAPKKKKAAKKG
jgi:hypothetical protein